AAAAGGARRGHKRPRRNLLRGRLIARSTTSPSMRVSVRLSWLAVLGVAAVPLMCSFPTDKSDEVFVVVVPSDSLAAHGLLDRGGRDQVFARAYHRLTNGDSVQLSNIAFAWFSS